MGVRKAGRQQDKTTSTHNIGEKGLRDLIYDVQLFLHENKQKPLTYDLYMRAVQETADNLVAPEGATIQ